MPLQVPSSPNRSLAAQWISASRALFRRSRHTCGDSRSPSWLRANSTGQTDPIIAAIMVAANSPIKTALDLQGKTVAVSAVGDISYLGIRAMIDAAGGDSTTVKWIEVPGATVSSAIQSGARRRRFDGRTSNDARRARRQTSAARRHADQLRRPGFSRGGVRFDARLLRQESPDRCEICNRHVACGGVLQYPHGGNIRAPRPLHGNRRKDDRRHAPRVLGNGVRSGIDPAHHRPGSKIQGYPPVAFGRASEMLSTVIPRA